MATKSFPNALRFDLNPKEIEELCDRIITDSRKILDEIAKIPAKERTWENTVIALADEPYVAETSSVYFPSQVSDNKEIRDASTAAVNKLEEFSVEQKTREDLYRAVLEFTENNQSFVQNLNGEDKRLLEKILQGFKRNGLGLEETKRNRVKDIKQKLAQLTIKFQQNLNEDLTKLYFTLEQLEGLPSDFLESLSKENDKYVVSLKYPELFPVLKQCKVEDTRKQMRHASAAKCMKENTPIFEEILLLRQEEAQLLGYEDHAAYELEPKMAKNSKIVLDFLNDLVQKLEKPAKKEIAHLLSLKKEEKEKRKEIFDGILNIWDLQYYHNMLLENEYQINQEVIKEYFPLHKVTEGLLSIFSEVLGMRFEEIKEYAHIWHADVKQFIVYDGHTNAFMGHLYLDLFPRDGKYGHAAEFDLLKGFTRPNGKRDLPAAALVANFNKPTATKPSLLKFDEVVTFFHELGHAVHELCSSAKYHRFAGTSVERDFVEAPSQMLENWCYDAEVLRRLSGHYLDLSKPLPDDLREKLIAGKNVDEAILNRRQLHFGVFDMIIHTTKGPVDTAKYWFQCMKEIALFEEIPNTNGAASFGHLVGGYSAGYYGYMWSKVYSCDMFDRFKKEGLLNKTVGKAYRELILATGGTKDSMDVLIEFLGRPPNAEAFLKEIGIHEDNGSSKL